MAKRLRSKAYCFYLIISVLTTVLPGFGQPPHVFNHLSTNNGLSNSNVNAIIKDGYGFLWVATQYGLNRFDGYEFKVYTTTNSGEPNSMITNNIWGISEDGIGNIWLNSFNYMVYNRAKDNFITDVPAFLQDMGIHTEQNYRIYIDINKELWVFSGANAYLYNFTNNSLKVHKLETGLDELEYTRISDNEKYIFAISDNGILFKIDKKTGIQTSEKLKTIEKPGLYNRIYVDLDGGLWLAGWSDIIYYKGKSAHEWEKLQLITEIDTQQNRVLAIADDNKGNIWLGTDHNGLFIYSKSTRTITSFREDPNTRSSLASNNITSIYRDDNGIIWTGHSKKGISYHHSSFQNIVNFWHPQCRDVSAIVEDRQGRIWLGTDGYGLFIKESRDNQVRKLPVGSNPVVSLLEDRKGRVWVGTFMDGLYCFEGTKISHYKTENSRLASNDIWRFTEDRYGNLWIGSLGGALQVLRNGRQNLNQLENICENIKYPMDLFYNNGDKLYVATVFGLWEVDITTGDCIVYQGNKRGTQTFRQNSISSVFVDNRGLFWLGHSEGLTIWDTKKDTLYFIDRESGLNDNIIQGIAEDARRNIWVITNNGLSVIIPDYNYKEEVTFSIRNFTTKDGLIDNFFNSQAIYRLANEDIIVGGTEGYSIINPNKMLETNQPPAKVVFTDLIIGNNRVKLDSVYNRRKILVKPIEQTQSVTFRHNDRQIVFQYTAGDLLYADKIRYAYKLVGFHNDWQYTSGNTIVFSSLPPGDYSLNVQACNSDGKWSDHISSIAITVTPPFYMSMWAIIVYFMLFIGLLGFALYYISKRNFIRIEQQRAQFEREQKANLDEMKLRFFTNVSHDLRTPLTLIITPLQNLLDGPIDEGIRKKLDIIYRSATQLHSLINALLDFRKLDFGAEALKLNPGDMIGFIKELCIPFYTYAHDRQINFSVVDEQKICMMKFDHDKVKKILLNLLSNAFKFTPDGGSITLRIYQEGEMVNLSVTDTGDGISDEDKPRIFERFYQSQQNTEQTGSGIGLHIVNEYVRLHGGVIRVDDNNPKGSIFVVELPVIDAEANEPDHDFGDINEIETTEIEEETLLPVQPVLLFVDDNKDLCDFIADSFTDDFTVILANNGQQALEQLHDNDVTIVVSDVMMPVMSGTELCKRIKTNIQWSHIPVILLTARTAEEYQIQGLELGADDYLTKPFNFNVLKLRIFKFIEWTEKCHRSFSQKLDISPGEITITSLDEKLIGKAIHIVEEHIGDPDFTVEELGSAVGLSRSHLYKKLMSITGKGPAEFIRAIRLKRGMQLLEKSQMQIAEIAYTVGFNSPKRFSINFKSEFGISPSDYLRSINQSK